MTPQEKAKELLDKMYYNGRYDDKEDYIPAMAWKRAKQCALIAVNELLEECRLERDWYWDRVKEEIEKL